MSIGQKIIQCPESIDGESSSRMMDEMPADTDNCSGVTLDFSRTRTFDPRLLPRLIAIMGKQLRSKGRNFFAKNASAALATEIRVNGLDSTIKFIEETQAAPKPKPGLNVEFINPFIASTISTLQTQCGLQLQMDDKPFLRGTKTLPAIEIAGIIGLTSAVFNGSVSICFPKATFLGVMEGMLGEKFEEITPDLQDGAGELLNIIFGQSKVTLNEKGFGIEKAIPTVVRAADLSIRQYSGSPVLVILFTSGKGPLYIEIALEG